MREELLAIIEKNSRIDLKELAVNNGLSVVECFDADRVHRPNETSERIYIIVQV